MRVNECRVSVRDVRDSRGSRAPPHRRSDASLTPCQSMTPSEFGERWNIGNVRDSPHVPVNSPRLPRFASRAEIRVAWTPSDDEPFPHFSLSLPRNTFLFWNPHRDIYIYAYSLIFNTPRYFGRRNTRTFPMFQRSSLRLSRGGAVQDRACLSLPLEQRGPPCFSTWSIRVWHAPVLCARG